MTSHTVPPTALSTCLPKPRQCRHSVGKNRGAEGVAPEDCPVHFLMFHLTPNVLVIVHLAILKSLCMCIGGPEKRPVLERECLRDHINTGIPGVPSSPASTLPLFGCKGPLPHVNPVQCRQQDGGGCPSPQVSPPGRSCPPAGGTHPRCRSESPQDWEERGQPLAWRSQPGAGAHLIHPHPRAKLPSWREKQGEKGP